MPDARDFQQCRALGHSWKHQPRKPQQDHGRVGLVSTCPACGTRRTKWMDSKGQLWGSSYDYPEGYSQHGEERLETYEWRSLFVTSLFPTEKVPQ